MAATETTAGDPYYTIHTCTECGTEVHGLHGRWTCSVCSACSPYRPPPGGWQADAGYRERPKLPPKPPSDVPAAEQHKAPSPGR